jgi:hypothetical protein
VGDEIIFKKSYYIYNNFRFYTSAADPANEAQAMFQYQGIGVGVD